MKQRTTSDIGANAHRSISDKLLESKTLVAVIAALLLFVSPGTGWAEDEIELAPPVLDQVRHACLRKL